MFKRETWKNFDFLLFGAVLFLCIFGLVLINTSIAGNIDLANYVSRQAQFLGIGLVVMITVTLINYHYWKSLATIFYVITFALLGLVLAAGTTSFGSERWLTVGGINIQPAEMSKIVIILTLATYFSRNHEKQKNLRWVLLSILIVAGLVVPILLQPNLSSSILLLVIWASMIWISGLPVKFLLLFGIPAIILAVAAFPALEPYQQERIMSFIRPAEGARYGNAYNVEQALITIGNGGLFGQGYGNGTQVQLRFLKVRSTDYIFSVMAEEFGFVGTILIVAILVFVIIRCIRAARLADDNFGAMVAYGFATLIAFQTMLNIGVNLKLLPVTGQTLPFISYGGSSLLSLMLGIGLIESVLLHRQT